MTRREYEDIISRPHVFDEETLRGLRALLIGERHPEARYFENVLMDVPIEKPPPEIGLSPLSFYGVEISHSKAKQILTVLTRAERMYGREATFENRTLAALRDEWAGLCQALRMRKNAKKRGQAAVTAPEA